MAVIGCSENAHDFLRASITVRTADLLTLKLTKDLIVVIFKTLKQEVSRT